jgi:hypothetical protein
MTATAPGGGSQRGAGTQATTPTSRHAHTRGTQPMSADRGTPGFQNGKGDEPMTDDSRDTLSWQVRKDITERSAQIERRRIACRRETRRDEHASRPSVGSACTASTAGQR